MRNIYFNNNNVIYYFSHEDLENICIDMTSYERDAGGNILMIPYNVEFNDLNGSKVFQENQKLSISKLAFVAMVKMVKPELYQKYQLLLQE